MGSPITAFADLDVLAKHLRDELESKKFILLYAYNGTGKTRLSMAFKDIGKQGDARDTLYFNAFTEDLFTWDNDLEGDSARVLKINSASRFFAGLAEMEMDTRSSVSAASSMGIMTPTGRLFLVMTTGCRPAFSGPASARRCARTSRPGCARIVGSRWNSHAPARVLFPEPGGAANRFWQALPAASDRPLTGWP